MTDTTMDNNTHEIPEERRFVWRNIDAFLTGELSDDDRARIEAFLCECPYTKEYVETEKEFAEAVRRCVNEAPAKCPESLRARVMTALDQCEIEDVADARRKPQGKLLGFPWLGAVMMAAASIMLVVALVLFFGGSGSTVSLHDELAPMVSTMSMDVPRSDSCRFRDANAEYVKHFNEAPDLPHFVDGRMLMVSDWNCDDLDGRKVMKAIYDSPDGERFGFMVVGCECLENVVSSELSCAEVVVGDKVVLLWREGEFYRALIGKDAIVLQRLMQHFRKSQ